MKCPQCQTENRDDSRFCINCGNSLNVDVPLDDGTRRHRSSVKKYAQGKDPTLAAILSLIFPGIAIGQFYNGDVLKGLVMLVGTIVLSFTVLGPIAIWVWSIIDAYQVAKGNRKLWS